MRWNVECALILSGLVLLTSCDGGKPDEPATKEDSATAPDVLKRFISETPPEAAVPLMTPLKGKTFISEIAVVGKVGEMQANLAAFRLLDESLSDCNRPGDPCKKPWDY